MRFVRLVVALVGSSVLHACACDLSDEAFDFAGSGAVDCGHVARGASAADGFACALDALEGGRPFVLRLELSGIDSHVAEAWAGTKSGTTVKFLYDGDAGGGGGDDDPRIERYACSEPKRRTLTEADEGLFFVYGLAVGDDVIGCRALDFSATVCD